MRVDRYFKRTAFLPAVSRVAPIDADEIIEGFAEPAAFSRRGRFIAENDFRIGEFRRRFVVSVRHGDVEKLVKKQIPADLRIVAETGIIDGLAGRKSEAGAAADLLPDGFFLHSADGEIERFANQFSPGGIEFRIDFKAVSVFLPNGQSVPFDDFFKTPVRLLRRQDGRAGQI